MHAEIKNNISFEADPPNERNPGYCEAFSALPVNLLKEKCKTTMAKAPPIIGSNRLTILKPEMSSSPFKYDPLFQSGGENSVFENINNSQPCTNMKKPLPQSLIGLKAVYLALQQRSHQGRALESFGPPTFSLLSPSLRLQSYLKQDLEAPFVVFSWNKTNRIQVFWLALARRSHHVCLPSCDQEVVTSEKNLLFLCM